MSIKFFFSKIVLHIRLFIICYLGLLDHLKYLYCRLSGFSILAFCFKDRVVFVLYYFVKDWVVIIALDDVYFSKILSKMFLFIVLFYTFQVFSKTNKGRVKKSIFATPDSVTGRVGVGTCGVSGRPMTAYQMQEKWKK